MSIGTGRSHSGPRRARDAAIALCAVLASAFVATTPQASAAPEPDATTLTVQCISTSDLGQTVYVLAALRDAATGDRIGNQQLELERDDEFDESLDVAKVQSSADNGVYIPDVPPSRGQVVYTVRYQGNNTHAASEGACTTRVLGEPTTLNLDRVTLTGLSAVEEVDSPISGTLRSGTTPLVERMVTAQDTFSGETLELVPVQTGPSGFFTLTLPAPKLGVHLLTLRFAGDQVYEPVTVSQTVWAQRPTFIALDGPESLPTSPSPTKFTITVTDTHGLPVADLNLVLRVRGTSWTSSTNGDGQVFVTFPMLGDLDPLRIDAEFRPGVTEPGIYYGPSSGTWHWAARPRYFFTSSKPAFTAGDTGTFQVGFSQQSSASRPMPAITYTPYGAAAQSVPLTQWDGALFNRKLFRNATIRITSPLSYNFLAGTQTFRVWVAPRLTQAVAGAWDRVRAVYLVHRRTDPRFILATMPLRSGTCAYARIQRYRDGAWRQVKRTGCLVLDSRSTASVRLVVDPRVGDRWRVRFETRADAMNTAGTGRWQTVRFTR